MTIPHHYSIWLIWSDEDAAYVATSAEFPGLSGVSADSQAAMSELAEAIDMALEALRDEGRPAPAARTLPQHSGQIRLRMPRSLHGDLARCAEDEGVSLNTLAVSILSRGVGQLRLVRDVTHAVR
jgi:predicted RNase H-like HicB family nuclease